MTSKTLSPQDKKTLRDAFRKAVDECIKLGYRPSYFIQDLTSLEVDVLVYKYVLAKAPTEGFTRLWEMKRLDLTVEAIVWRHRQMFEPTVGSAARTRLREYGFVVETGATVAPSRSRP